MTYIIEKPAVSSTGKERPLITIEFAPKIHPTETEYSYEHPRFTFGDKPDGMASLRVSIINTYPELEFTVCALELIESKTPSGRLLNQPRWRYKVTDGQNSFWKEESALTRYTQKTCSICDRFKNYNEPNSRGWCYEFNHQARTHHFKTNDCIINGASESELDKPHASFKIGSMVKVINIKDHLTEWLIFEVVEQKYNGELFDDAESYLNQPEWFYRLANADEEDTFAPIWVRENEICRFDESHNVCISEVF